MHAGERTLLRLMLGLIIAGSVAGCGDKREQRVIIREEQHEGEVREVSPAGRSEGETRELSRPEMIVE